MNVCECYSNTGHSVTVMPMFFAVPITLRIADSTLSVLRSGNLISAISCSDASCGQCCQRAALASPHRYVVTHCDTQQHALFHAITHDAAQRSPRSAHTLIFAMVTLPTLVLLGEPDPVSMPAACLSSTDAGGVLRIKVKLRSCDWHCSVLQWLM